jgi:hypothetical protein
MPYEITHHSLSRFSDPFATKGVYRTPLLILVPMQRKTEYGLQNAKKVKAGQKTYVVMWQRGLWQCGGVAKDFASCGYYM